MFASGILNLITGVMVQTAFMLLKEPSQRNFAAWWGSRCQDPAMGSHSLLHHCKPHSEIEVGVGVPWLYILHLWRHVVSSGAKLTILVHGIDTRIFKTCPAPDEEQLSGWTRDSESAWRCGTAGKATGWPSMIQELQWPHDKETIRGWVNVYFCCLMSQWGLGLTGTGCRCTLFNILKPQRSTTHIKCRSFAISWIYILGLRSGCILCIYVFVIWCFLLYWLAVHKDKLALDVLGCFLFEYFDNIR